MELLAAWSSSFSILPAHVSDLASVASPHCLSIVARGETGVAGTGSHRTLGAAQPCLAPYATGAGSTASDLLPPSNA